jgi:endoglucanase
MNSINRLALMLVPLAALSCRAAAAPPELISSMDGGFLFAYGTWEGKASMSGGIAKIQATPRGGAGANVTVDLSEARDSSPVLRLKVLPANRAKGLRMLLKAESSEAIAIYEFSLPASATEGFTTLVPREGAALGKPNSTDKGMPDLRKIQQWQLQGDWSSDDPMAVEVDSISIALPDAVLKAARAERERREKDEAEAKRREQAALAEKFKPGQPTSPIVERVSRIAPDVLAIEIQAGRVEPSQLSAYKKQPGDEIRGSAGKPRQLVRGGQEIGWIIGAKNEGLVTYETLTGDPLVAFLGEQITVNGQKPEALWRKSKPTDWKIPIGMDTFALRHTFYLKLSSPVTGTVALDFGGLNVKTPTLSVVLNDTKTLSEAIHVQQIGYRPDDPAKRGFLSLWRGTGGAQPYEDGMPFSLIDEKTGAAVFTGKTERVLAEDQTEKMAREANFNKTGVWRMDFSTFKTPGRYRVSVAGIGCSYPFTIGPNVWTDAFKIQMRGLYHERSGVALSKPISSYDKPRDFHPLDIPVYQSTYSLFDGPTEGAGAEKASTGQKVPDAWGGYHDAGDWQPRRASHMRVTMAQLEIFEMFPAFFSKLPLKIAPKKPGVPDILTEALFEVDCFRRLQKPDGGVPYGIETNGDPIDGEVSWMQSMPAYVFAPDSWSSFIHAGVAGRLAKCLAPYDAKTAALFRASAVKAFAWAERDWQNGRKNSKFESLWQVASDRNLAALVLYDLTGEARYKNIFLSDTSLMKGEAVFAWGTRNHRDAAFLAARTTRALPDMVKKNARNAIEGQAQSALRYAAQNAFNVTTPDSGKPQFLSFYSCPDAIELCRAHYLTKKPEYLAGIVQACQFGAGANPTNLVFTTGLGANPIKNPLFLDTRHTGQPAPEGLTVYGIVDFEKWTDGFATWPLQFVGPNTVPEARSWPIHEAYWDIFLYPCITEWTVDQWDKTVYTWGYLAAR